MNRRPNQLPAAFDELRWGQRTILALVAALCLAVVCSRPAPAAEPFYESVLRDGLSAYATGDHASAQRFLRVACFGLLEEPPLLARGLTYLALSQGELADRAGFDRTLARLIEVERRFGGYTQGGLAPAIREQLEARLETWGSWQQLRGIPVFDGVAQRLAEREVLALPVESRRIVLMQRLQDEPQNERWILIAAQMELEQGQSQAALQALSPQLATSDPSAAVRCLAALAHAGSENCAAALPLVNACAELPTASLPNDTVAPVLRCQLQGGQIAEARAVLARLSSEQRRQAERGLDRAQRRALRQPLPPDGDRDDPTPELEPEPVEAPPEEPDQTVASPSYSQAESEELERLILSLFSAKRVEELGATLDQARAIADRHPSWIRAQQVAGEVAYRSRRWDLTVDYLGRAGDDPARPDLSFYRAISLYERGQREAAAEVLAQCVDRLQKTPFVTGYIEKILGPAQ